MGELSVRRATSADEPAVRSLFEAFYREEGLAHAVGAVAATLPQVLRRDDTACFVAEADGEIVGAAAMSFSYGLEVGLYAELEDLYVRPDARGGGAASALVEAVMAEAQARGCADVQVVLTRHAQENTGLIAWYEKRGFKATGRTILERPIGPPTEEDT